MPFRRAPLFVPPSPPFHPERKGVSTLERRQRSRRRRPIYSTLTFGLLCVVAGVAIGRMSVSKLVAAAETLDPFVSPHVSPHPNSPGPGKSAPRSRPAPATDLGTHSKGPVSHPSKAPAGLPAAALINVAPQDQFPQLPNGCEVTSLSMLLSFAGDPLSKMTLAKEMPVDPTKRVMGSGYTIKFWGNPNVGFVGNVYKKPDGYGIYNGPLFRFLNQLLPGRAVNLSGDRFDQILAQVARGTPVEVWTTTIFRPTNYWVTWQSPEGVVHATPLEHAVLIVGYDSTQIFVNNPLNGRKAEPVDREQFIRSWIQMGRQAITVRP